MNEELFRSQYFGSWDVEREHLLHDLGQQYHNRCDAFDDEHLSGPIGPGGGVLPADWHERRLMILNAEHVQSDVVYLGAQMGFTARQVIAAISRTAHNT
jgi:hypothetical protein